MHQKQQEHGLQVQSHLKVAVLPMALYRNAKMETDAGRQVGRKKEREKKGQSKRKRQQ